jgi:PHD/YefM family antitoxin component YafN of YafNO toxin-antitoxin module
MAEQFKSITELRKDLPTLSQTVQGGADRFVITNQGKPQAVLLGYGEYKGLLAAAELLHRPKELADLEEGLAQTEKLSFEQLKENLHRRKASQGHAEAAVNVGGVVGHAQAFSIHQKLDEIRGDMNRVLDRLRADEMVFFTARDVAEEGTVRKHDLSTALSKAKVGEAIKVELRKVSSARRSRPAARAVRTELKAER